MSYDPNWTHGNAQGRLEAGKHVIRLSDPQEIAGSECSSQIAANAIVWLRKHVNWYYFERATNARYKA